MSSAACFLLMGWLTTAQAAQTAFLSLRVDGTDVLGESSIRSLGRADTIECMDFEHAVGRAPGRDGAAPDPRRLLPTIVVRKQIDRSTPLLVRAMVMREPLEGEFRFYRPAASGAGTEELFYTVAITNGRVLSMVQRSLGPQLMGETAPPMYEEVVFLFGGIAYTYEPGGVTYQCRGEQLLPARQPADWRADEVFGMPASKPSAVKLAPKP
jgi:type VI secretion system secreted protein Hcp